MLSFTALDKLLHTLNNDDIIAVVTLDDVKLAKSRTPSALPIAYWEYTDVFNADKAVTLSQHQLELDHDIKLKLDSEHTGIKGHVRQSGKFSRML